MNVHFLSAPLFQRQSVLTACLPTSAQVLSSLFWSLGDPHHLSLTHKGSEKCRIQRILGTIGVPNSALYMLAGKAQRLHKQVSC